MPQDYLFDNDGDLLIQNGDFVIGESTAQHQDSLMLLEKGELRQYPKTGVAVKSFINDDALGDLYPEIQRQFEADGMQIDSLTVQSDGVVNVKAKYRE